MSSPEEETPDDSNEMRVSDDGLSLEDLGAAYAQLVQGGDDPYADTPPDSAKAATPDAEKDADASDVEAPSELTPLSILEAMLFVGDAEGKPLTSQEIASHMRGVRASEVEELVEELNAQYESDNAAYRVASVEAGYAMQLVPELANLRDKFYGRVREARLSQPAIDVLAVVAYRQPISREEVDRLRGKPSGGVLSQLVRRQLLRVDKTTEKPRVNRYQTTDRFLQFFGLADISHLPQSDDPSQSF